jgi:DNA-binding transcriptional LysR family regulator
MFDPILLRSFLTVVDLLSFTAAAKRLGLTQSTVSGHVRKLESAFGRRLFLRDTHKTALTPDGEALAGFARTAMEAQDRATRYFAGSKLRGRLRFGASEDLVRQGLPLILRDFVRDHPLIDLELTVGVSGSLHQLLDEGALDLVFAKRPPGDTLGKLVWRDPLVWFGAPSMQIDPAQPLPLILLNPPSITRARALEALERAGRAWRITCASGSQSGVDAAAIAGLGIGPHALSLIPRGLEPLPPTAGLPPLGDVDFIISSGTREASGPAAALSAVIQQSARPVVSRTEGAVRPRQSVV